MLSIMDVMRSALGFLKTGQRRSLLGLDSPARFRRILQRERARSDSTGNPFALITFAARAPETAAETFATVAKILRRRLPWTDEIGWLNREHLAALLFNTPSAEALKVADDVCLGFSSDCLPPLCEVYCYPSHRIPGIDGPPQNGDRQSGRAKRWRVHRESSNRWSRCSCSALLWASAARYRGRSGRTGPAFAVVGPDSPGNQAHVARPCFVHAVS